MIKRILNKWQFGIVFRETPYNFNYKELSIYFLKFIRLPDEGHIIEKEHYKGFWFRKDIKFPDIIFRR